MTVVAIYLVITFGLGGLAMAVRLPPLVGFLAAGFVINALDVEDVPQLEVMADLGVTLLLFAIGLKLDVRILLRREVWLTTSVHMVVSVVLGSYRPVAGRRGRGGDAGRAEHADDRPARLRAVVLQHGIRGQGPRGAGRIARALRPRRHRHPGDAGHRRRGFPDRHQRSPAQPVGVDTGGSLAADPGRCARSGAGWATARCSRCSAS